MLGYFLNDLLPCWNLGRQTFVVGDFIDIERKNIWQPRVT